MIDKKTAAILALLVLVIITGLGWVRAELKPERVLPLPEGVNNWTEYFHGYEAYLGQEISASIIGGTSMEPTFGLDDLVLWVGVDNMAELGENDIIIFQHPTKPYIDNIVHRIAEVGIQNGEYRFRTKGDNSGFDQHWVPGEKVHGLVIGAIYRGSS